MRIYQLALQFVGVLLLSLGYHFKRHSLPATAVLMPFSPAVESMNDTIINGSNRSAYMTCRVAVTNSFPWHYETLESIAGQLPLKYLNLPPSCESIVFDFHIVRGEGRLHLPWRRYFANSMRGKDVSNLTTDRNNDSGDRFVRRVIGNLTVHPKPAAKKRPPRIMDIASVSNVTYHAQVEATCHCNGSNNNRGDKWMQQRESRTCIFHRACSAVANHSRAVWVSPHHQHYYIPSMLPKVTRTTDERTKSSKPMCTIGAIRKRKWDLVRGFLANGHATGNVTFRIMAAGKFPNQLSEYTNVTTQSIIMEYVKFHQAVAQCGAILPLLTHDQRDYFNTSKSRQRLSGQFAPIIAYKLPFVVHEDLYDLYKKHLPHDVPFATHNDTLDSFRFAMTEFLGKLDDWHAS